MCTSWHLGHFSGPPCHSNPHGQAYPKKHVSPSRQRRRARRESGRTHKSENVVNDNQPVKETLVNRDAEKVTTVARKNDSEKNDAPASFIILDTKQILVINILITLLHPVEILLKETNY